MLLQLDEKIPEDYYGWPAVFLGDYIDRGEDSNRLLRLLMRLTNYRHDSVICLMGNHEQMLLDFIDDPQKNARVWLGNGGLQTLASFRMSPPGDLARDPLAHDILRDKLVKTMGTEMLEWLRARPFSWQSGNVWVVHAGADPRCPMAEQPSRHLLWGHPAFLHKPRRDGQWIVHGHTVVDTPTVKDGRVALDTGAYATGVLSVAAITSTDVTFFQTGRS